MNFDPKFFLDISKELNEHNYGAHIRSVANRAYYAAFGVAKINTGLFKDSGSIHKDVIDFLQRTPDKNDKKAGKTLEELFKQRRDADYIYNKKINYDTSFILKNAEKIIDLLNNKKNSLTNI